MIGQNRWGATCTASSFVDQQYHLRTRKGPICGSSVERRTEKSLGWKFTKPMNEIGESTLDLDVSWVER